MDFSCVLQARDRLGCELGVPRQRDFRLTTCFSRLQPAKRGSKRIERGLVQAGMVPFEPQARPNRTVFGVITMDTERSGLKLNGRGPSGESSLFLRGVKEGMMRVVEAVQSEIKERAEVCERCLQPSRVGRRTKA